MRGLNRNRRDVYYSTVVKTEPIYDEYGNDTLEEKQTYSSPTLLRVNVSANSGQDAVETFGAQTEYSRILCIAGTSCALSEGDRVWFGVSTDRPHNYVVVKVADSKNGYLVALREVSKRE